MCDKINKTFNDLVSNCAENNCKKCFKFISCVGYIKKQKIIDDVEYTIIINKNIIELYIISYKKIKHIKTLLSFFDNNYWLPNKPIYKNITMNDNSGFISIDIYGNILMVLSNDNCNYINEFITFNVSI